MMSVHTDGVSAPLASRAIRENAIATHGRYRTRISFLLLHRSLFVLPFPACGGGIGRAAPPSLKIEYRRMEISALIAESVAERAGGADSRHGTAFRPRGRSRPPCRRP